MRTYSGPDKDLDLPELDLLTFLFGQPWTGHTRFRAVTDLMQHLRIRLDICKGGHPNSC